MYGIEFSIEQTFNQLQKNENFVVMSSTGLWGEVKHPRPGHEYESNALIIKIRFKTHNLNDILVECSPGASEIDRCVYQTIKREIDILKRQVHFATDELENVDHLNFFQKKEGCGDADLVHSGYGLFSECRRIDMHSQTFQTVAVNLTIPYSDVRMLERTNNLYSQLLNVEFGFANEDELAEDPDRRGLMRLMRDQYLAKCKEFKDRFEHYKANGNIYNYFLVDQVNEVGELYVNHLGEMNTIHRLKYPGHMPSGLYLTSSINGNVKHTVLCIKDVLNGKAESYGIYTSKSKCLDSKDNTEQTTKLTKENAELEKKFKTASDKLKKAEDDLTKKTVELENAKHEIKMAAMNAKHEQIKFNAEKELHKLKMEKENAEREKKNSTWGKFVNKVSSIIDTLKGILGLGESGIKIFSGLKTAGLFV